MKIQEATSHILLTQGILGTLQPMSWKRGNKETVLEEDGKQWRKGKVLVDT